MTDVREKLGGGFASIPADISAKRTSPTIVRQELLSHFRILNRTCFNKQLEDPTLHMLHDSPGGINEPMRYWINTKSGMNRPTISISKEKLLALEPHELFPELLETITLYWLDKEGKTPSKDHPEYQQKLKFIQDNATTQFIDIQKHDQHI